MGESAGAMSCMLHLVSPLSKGLFHKIVAMSGSPSTPFLHNDRKSKHYAEAMAKHLLRKKFSKSRSKEGGIMDNNNKEDIIKALRDLPGKTVIEASILFKDWDVAAPIPWKPCIDDYAGDKAFLPKSFEECLKLGEFAKNVPIIAGFTTEEGLILASQFHRSSRRWRMLFNNWDIWAPHLFFNRETDLVSLEDIEKAGKIRDKFFPAASSADKEDNANNNMNMPKLNETSLRTMEQIFSTAIFHAPLVKDIGLLMAAGVDVYAYEFGYRGSMTLNDVFRLSPIKLVVNFFGRHVGTKLYQKDLGVCHGDDMFYLFPFTMAGFPKSVKSAADKATSYNILTFVSKYDRQNFTSFLGLVTFLSF